MVVLKFKLNYLHPFHSVRLHSNSCSSGFCPSDSDPVILSLSDYVLKSKGGKGVAKEIAGLLSDIYPNE